MITFGYYWKKELVRLANRLRRRATQKRWTFSSSSALEKEVFIGAYSVRKLMESDKVSTDISSQTITATYYPIRKDQINQQPKHFTHRYALGSGERKTLVVKDLMNQFIHSYYFSPFVPLNKKMAGIFVASDRERKRGIYYISLDNLSDIFHKIGEEVVSKQEIDQLLNGQSLWGGRQ